MKKNVFFFLLSVMLFVNPGLTQIKVSSSGNVGINNTNPSYRLDVNGTLRLNSSGYNLIYSGTSLYGTSSSSQLGTSSYFWGYLYARYIFYEYTPIQYSDKILKTDIAEIDVVAGKLMNLRLVKYKMIPRLNEGETMADISNLEADNDQIGFIAQEMYEVFPDLVTTDDKGVLGIKYLELIPILVKAFQEQQIEIDNLKARIEKLESDVK
jgi:hypothetical protein